MEPQLEQEHLDAIHEFTSIIGDHETAYQKLAKSYGAPEEKDLATQVSQAMHLMQTQPTFEERFEKEVYNAKGFDLGKIFKAIKHAFKIIGKIFSPIVNAIKKAVEKHKEKKAAEAAAKNPPKPAAKAKSHAVIYVVGVFMLIAGVVAAVLFLGDEKKAA